MDIFVATTSKHKLQAVREAAEEVFPDLKINVQGGKASSDINEQPVGHDETMQGALNRLKNLKTLIGETRDAIFVSIESGIFTVKVGDEERWFDLGWVIVEDEAGKKHLSHSPGIEFDAEYVEEAKRRGFETTTVGSIIAEKTGADGTDPHSHLTGGTSPRSKMLKDTIKTTLAMLMKKKLDQQNS